MTQLFLIRGASGSGKSTLAEQLYEAYSSMGLDVMCIATDDYFLNDHGEYVFDRTKLHIAHTWCKHQVQASMEKECDVIIVHNTFTTAKEMKPYIDLANYYKCKLTSLIVENRHESDSVHDVPDSVVAAQRQRMRSNICL